MSCDACVLPVGITSGAGLMDVFDPEAGRRLQALTREEAYSWANDAQELAE